MDTNESTSGEYYPEEKVCVCGHTDEGHLKSGKCVADECTCTDFTDVRDTDEYQLFIKEM